MTNFLLYSNNFGFNTFYIEDFMEGLLKRTKDTQDLKGATTVIRWGTTANIPNGPHIINKSNAINETSNKGAFRSKASAKGLAPKTFLNVGDFIKFTDECVDKGIEIPQVIVRPQFHSRSENLFFCEDKKSLDKALEKCGNDYYISEYIKKEKEYRVFVAQGRPFIVAEKNHKNKTDISWGCVDEGTLDYIEWESWPLEIVKVATESFNLSKLHFAAVDVMVKDGKAYFLECNTAPEVWKYYGQCFGRVFTWMIKNHSKRIPIVDYKNWKNCIHPAMSESAITKNGE